MGAKSGYRDGHSIGPLLPIHLLGENVFKHHRARKT